MADKAEPVLHPEVRALADMMREMRHLLQTHNQTHWADLIAKSLHSIEKSDAYGLDQFLGLFGGMGSLNDCPLDDRFDKLMHRTWELANKLKRELV